MNPEDRTVIMYYIAILCALFILLVGNCGERTIMATTGNEDSYEIEAEGEGGG